MKRENEPLNVEAVLDYLADICDGVCTITPDIIAAEQDRAVAELLTGLLFLHEDLQHRTNAQEHAEKRLQSLNAGLEERIAERTSQLTAANQRLASMLEELRATQSQLVQTAKLASVGQFAAGVAHEINNPLVGVLNTAEFLKADLEDEELGKHPKLKRWPKYVDTILAASKRCRDITRALLSFARAPTEGRSVVAWRHVIDDTVKLVAGQIHKRGITVEVDVPADLRVNAVRRDLAQVMFNLLMNALQAYPGPGEPVEAGAGGASPSKVIHIRGYRCGPEVRVCVSDDGEGIPSEHIQRIFDPFFSTKGTSSGLGLAVSHGIAENHGGSLSVNSSHGHGAAFTFCLPSASSGISGR